MVLGLPDGITACLFDLDGVLTKTATVHAKAWKEMGHRYLAGTLGALICLLWFFSFRLRRYRLLASAIVAAVVFQALDRSESRTAQTSPSRITPWMTAPTWATVR